MGLGIEYVHCNPGMSYKVAIVLIITLSISSVSFKCEDVLALKIAIDADKNTIL